MSTVLPHKIVLSAGMPRAGSGWFYNLTHALWLAAGGQDAHVIRERYRLQRVLSEVNCNIGGLTGKRTLAVLAPYFLGDSFVIKIHSAPTDFGRWVFRRGWMIPTFVYRDPRDALLSAYEYGRRVEKTGRPNAFSFLETVADAINFMENYVVRDWQAWMSVPGIFTLRYEDLLLDYDSQIQRLVDFLQLDGSLSSLRETKENYRPGGADSIHGIHFNKGKIGRFRELLSPTERETCLGKFGPFLELMGYPA